MFPFPTQSSRHYFVISSGPKIATASVNGLDKRKQVHNSTAPRKEIGGHHYHHPIIYPEMERQNYYPVTNAESDIVAFSAGEAEGYGEAAVDISQLDDMSFGEDGHTYQNILGNHSEPQGMNGICYSESKK